MVECCVCAAYHIEQDTVFGFVSRFVRMLGPVLRAQCPGFAVVGGRLFEERGTAVIFGVEKDDVDTDAGFGLADLAGYFQQYACPAAAVVGALYGLVVVGGVGILISIRTAVPVGEKQYPLFFVGVERGDDVLSV